MKQSFGQVRGPMKKISIIWKEDFSKSIGTILRLYLGDIALDYNRDLW